MPLTKQEAWAWPYTLVHREGQGWTSYGRGLVPIERLGSILKPYLEQTAGQLAEHGVLTENLLTWLRTTSA